MFYKINLLKSNLFFSLNKPINFTSNSFLNYIKKYSSFLRIGHTGTLDPSASGVLIIYIGKKSNSLDFIINKCKRYLVFTLIGIESDSLDLIGKILYFNKCTLSLKKNYLKSFLFFIKKSNKQNFPDYSSIKHNGKELYKYSRLEIKIKSKFNHVLIYKIFSFYFFKNFIIFDVECSKGVYVRELIKFLGKKFKLPICVYKIIRLKVSDCTIIDSFNFF